MRAVQERQHRELFRADPRKECGSLEFREKQEKKGGMRRKRDMKWLSFFFFSSHDVTRTNQICGTQWLQRDRDNLRDIYS